MGLYSASAGSQPSAAQLHLGEACRHTGQAEQAIAQYPEKTADALFPRLPGGRRVRA